MSEDISLIGVTKIFATGVLKRKVGVLDLDLQIPRGEVVGLLGPNGFRSLRSPAFAPVVPSTGHAAGSREARAIIGYLPENPRFQRFLRAREILRYYGGLHGITGVNLAKRVQELLELVGLRDAADERVHGFSKGMVQRLAVAQAMLNEPRLLIFDEPMSGLDPLGRIEIRTLIARIHEQNPNTTIFFSSHVLSDVQELCSSVALLKRGRLQRHCSIRELLGEEATTYSLTVRDLGAEHLQRFALGNEIRKTPIGLSFSVEGGETLVGCLSEVKKRGGVLVRVSSEQRSLEEALYSDLAAKETPADLRLAGGM